MHESDRIPNLQLIGSGVLVGCGTPSNRAKWRSSPSARWSVLRKGLTDGSIVRDACFRQFGLTYNLMRVPSKRLQHASELHCAGDSLCRGLSRDGCWLFWTGSIT